MSYAQLNIEHSDTQESNQNYVFLLSELSLKILWFRLSTMYKENIMKDTSSNSFSQSTVSLVNNQEVENLFIQESYHVKVSSSFVCLKSTSHLLPGLDLLLHVFGEESHFGHHGQLCHVFVQKQPSSEDQDFRMKQTQLFSFQTKSQKKQMKYNSLTVLVLSHTIFLRLH